MNAKTIYKILAILIGYGLIIGVFFLFGQSLEDRIKVLDIIVSILVYTQLVQFAIYPLIDLDNPAHKEVGMMGIYFYVLSAYCILAIGLMFFGIVYAIPFHIQLMGQIFLVFLGLLGRVTTLHSGDKVEHIYNKEQQMKEGKVTLKIAMDSLMDEIPQNQPLNISMRKLDDIYEELRYVTPSMSIEAKHYESEFCQTIEDIKVLMRNADLNQEKIEEKINRLERILSRRKNINS